MSSSGTPPFVPRVAVVTGAAQGIGRAIALRLAQDGLDVVINDLPTKSDRAEEAAGEIRALGRKAIVVFADISSEEQVENLIKGAVQQLGQIDVFVANAGISPSGPKNITKMSLEEWDFIDNINTRGTFISYRAAAQQMIKQGTGGRIMGASSIGGRQAIAGLSGYCASKFAVRGLTQCLAGELAPHNVTVNAYAPGLIMTDMLARAIDSPPEVDSETAKTWNEVNYSKLGTPDDIASLVSYLAKPESHYITGQTISINGGMHFD